MKPLTAGTNSFSARASAWVAVPGPFLHRAGQPSLSFTLSVPPGLVQGVMWDKVSDLTPLVSEGNWKLDSQE